MSDLIASIRAEIERLNKQPCECVVCADCGGSGNVRVDMRGHPIPFGDDLADLEPCEECRSGIVETCERCLEIEELDEQIEEEEERRARRHSELR
jgi:hypothetical protein